MMDACAVSEEEAFGALLFAGAGNRAVAALVERNRSTPAERVENLGDRTRVTTGASNPAQLAAMAGFSGGDDLGALVAATGLGIPMEGLTDV